MAFDFPSSPTVGQVANGYVWNGQAWTGNGNLAAVAPPGATPPASPVNGQLWWDSTSGNTFLWYVDANTSQWVQISGPGLGDAPVDGKKYVRQNGVWTPPDVELIETASVGTGPNKEFLLPAGYKSFEMKLRGIAGDTATVLVVQLSLDGTTWKGATNDYTHTHQYNYVSGGTAQYGSDDGVSNSYAISGWGIGAGTLASVGVIEIFPGDATDFTTFMSRTASYSSGWGSSTGGGYLGYAGRPVKGRLAVGGGNFAKGSYDLYGYR